jgi:hypothetical protein
VSVERPQPRRGGLLRDHHRVTRCARVGWYSSDHLVPEADHDRADECRRSLRSLAIRARRCPVWRPAHQCGGAAHWTCVDRNPLTWLPAGCRVEVRLALAPAGDLVPAPIPGRRPVCRPRGPHQHAHVRSRSHPFSSQHLPRLRRCGAQRGARGRPCGGVSMTGPGPLPVLVARGGVAGPGSLLARRHLARERMERTLLTPGRGSSGTGPRHSPSCPRAGVRGGSARRDPRGLGGRVVICGSQVEDRSRLAVANAGERLSYEARVVTVGAGSDRCHRHPGPDPHPSRARLWARATHP